jgi:hypothetical protein
MDHVLSRVREELLSQSLEVTVDDGPRASIHTLQLKLPCQELPRYGSKLSVVGCLVTVRGGIEGKREVQYLQEGG